MKLMTNGTVTIPKEITKGDDLVVIPRLEYEKLLRWRKKIEWEEKDADEAIRIFKKELKEGRLQKINSLSELRKK